MRNKETQLGRPTVPRRRTTGPDWNEMRGARKKERLWMWPAQTPNLKCHGYAMYP